MSSTCSEGDRCGTGDGRDLAYLLCVLKKEEELPIQTRHADLMVTPSWYTHSGRCEASVYEA